MHVLDSTKTLESRSDARLAALQGHDLAIRAGGGTWPPQNQPEKAMLGPARTKSVPGLLPRPSSYGTGGIVGFVNVGVTWNKQAAGGGPGARDGDQGGICEHGAAGAEGCGDTRGGVEFAGASSAWGVMSVGG